MGPREPIPLVVLGGSDRRPTRLPEGGRAQHPLSGYKGADLRIDGRPLIEHVVERASACRALGPVFVVGPRRVYEPILRETTIVDADGSLGQNVRAAIAAVRAVRPGRPIGFLTCDVLADPGVLDQLMERYDSGAPWDLWFPMIRAPEDRARLGASQWKPAYRIVPDRGVPAVGVLPGHLAIADVDAMRLPFIERLFDLAYRTRNRPIGVRRTILVRGVLGALLYQDLLHVLGLRAPTLTWSVLFAGVSAARRLRDGRATRAELEDAVRRIFVTARHRRNHPERRVGLPIVDALSLALDIDTEEEARAFGARIEPDDDRRQ